MKSNGYRSGAYAGGAVAGREAGAGNGAGPEPDSSSLNSKIPPSLRPLLAELERFYPWANQAFFAGRLSPDVMIVIAPGGRRDAPGAFAPERWQGTRQPGDRAHEIVLAAECLDLPPPEILHVVLREMIHLANAEDGRRDHDPERRYFNKHFRRQAEAVGLRVERDGRRGYGRTILCPESYRRIVEEFRPDPTAFSAFRPEAERPERPPKLRRGVCRCPRSAWTLSADPDAICKRCWADFTAVPPRKRRPGGPR